MNKALKITLIVIGALVVVGGSLAAGAGIAVYVNRNNNTNANAPATRQQNGQVPNFGNPQNRRGNNGQVPGSPYYGMPNNGMPNNGAPNNGSPYYYYGNPKTLPGNPGVPGYGFRSGPGMMNPYYGNNPAVTPVTPPAASTAPATATPPATATVPATTTPQPSVTP